MPDQTDHRDRIADAVTPLLLDTLPKVIARARGYEIADAVLAVPSSPAVTPPPALTEVGRLRAQVEVLQQDAERDQGLAKVGARCMREGHQGLIEQGRVVLEGWRFALSVALDLDTEAPWDAIHERVKELADRPAVGARQPDSETGPQQLYPARNTWTFEVCYDPDGDKWHGCGGTYDSSVFENAHETAKDDFRHRAEHDRQRRKFRMVRATTTYTVEVEHQPAAVERAAAADAGEETRRG